MESVFNTTTGGFADGASSQYVAFVIFRASVTSQILIRFDGTVIVKRSIAMQQPIIYVSINYR